MALFALRNIRMVKNLFGTHAYYKKVPSTEEDIWSAN